MPKLLHCSRKALTLCVLLFSLANPRAQDAGVSGKQTLGIAAISPTDSLRTAVSQAGKSLPMGRVLESLDAQLLDAVNATRKFQIVAVADLKELIKRQELAHSGNFDANDKSLPQMFKLAGAKYFVITTIDDFSDINKSETLGIQKEVLTVRRINLSAVAKIFDSTTGLLLESANFQISTNKAASNFSSTSVDGNETDQLLVAIARDMAEKVARRVADVVYPAKVLVKREKQITINRGDGTGMGLNQVWDVFAVGEELIDPDTKEKLGHEEVRVGRATITQILPKTSTARLDEDNGVVAGAILRRVSP